ncbi:MAG: hypothetical protein C5B59_02520 [Bacteroidetes bacterium]|nr:MAG: hypothetical protein C5B59_02520 [Bacteroidota bacterium]
MEIQQLLQTYYSGLARKKGWESVLAEDFEFIGGNMLKSEPIIGKQSYIGVIDRFGKVFTDVRAKDTFISDQGAFVLANYDYVFPGGKKVNANVAELWKAKGGKLCSLRIFFDTESFNALLRG